MSAAEPSDPSPRPVQGRVREGGIVPQAGRRLATTALGMVLFFVVFAAGGALAWWLMDVISRTDISGDGWSLRGNGALIVPVVVGPALLAAGWASLAQWFRGERWGLLSGLLAGLATIVLSGAAGFAPILLPGVPIPLATLPISLGAGLGLAVRFGRPRRATYAFAAVVFALALVGGALAGGSVTLIAPLLVPLLVAVPLLTVSAKSDDPRTPLGAGWRVLGYVGLPVVLVVGFMAATRFGPSLLAAANPARSGHTTTLLNDGRVLIAGGSGDHGELATAHIYYDPSSSRWTAAPNMGAPRTGHTATRLRDGRVLVAGGRACSSLYLSSPQAEMYDAEGGRWSETGPAFPPVAAYASMLLADARVLLVGFVPGTDDITGAGQLYDPATDSWSRATGTDVGFHLKLVLLPDGRVLALGDNPPESSARIYDPATDGWALATAPRGLAAVLAAVGLSDGRVLALGGDMRFAGPPAAALFDASTGTWALAASPLLSAFEGATATLLQDSRVLLAGGTILSDSPPRGGPTAHAELYDPRDGTWAATMDMLNPRFRAHRDAAQRWAGARGWRLHPLGRTSHVRALRPTHGDLAANRQHRRRLGARGYELHFVPVRIVDVDRFDRKKRVLAGAHVKSEALESMPLVFQCGNRYLEANVVQNARGAFGPRPS